MNIGKGWLQPIFKIFSIDRNDEYYEVVFDFDSKPVEELMHHTLLWNYIEGKYDYRTSQLAYDIRGSAIVFSEKLMHRILEAENEKKGLRVPNVVISREGIALINLLMKVSERNDELGLSADSFRDNTWNYWISIMNSQIETAQKILATKIPEYQICEKISELEENLSKSENLRKEAERENLELKRKLDRIKDIWN
jgi:hypothetical protein